MPAGFSCGRLRCVFGASFRPTLLAIGANLLAIGANRFGPEKLITSSLLRQEVIIQYKLIISEITRPNMLIPYFAANLMHYFYISKNIYSHKKWYLFLKSFLKIKMGYFTSTYISHQKTQPVLKQNNTYTVKLLKRFYEILFYFISYR